MPKFILYISITCLLVFLGLGCEEIDPTQLEPPLASGISLELSWGSINFQEDIYEYNLTVPDNFTSLDITPTYNEELKMRINNQLVESGETSEKLYLQYGVENIINLDLIRENSWDSHYVIKIRINSMKRLTVTYDYVNDGNDRQDIYDYDEQRLNYAYSLFRTNTGNLDYFQRKEYNAGRQLISIHQYKGGVNTYNYFKSYNDSGFLTDYYCYDQDGVLYWVYHYEYVNERQTRYTITYASGTLYTYDREFNALNQVERVTRYFNGAFDYVGIYSYNSERKKIVYTQFSNPGETAIDHVLNYDYNEMGYCSKIIQSRTSNNYTATYEYEFYEF